MAGFNDLAASAWVGPRLTTIAAPRYAIGHAAATMLLQRMAGGTLAPAQLDLGYTLVVRESTRSKNKHHLCCDRLTCCLH